MNYINMIKDFHWIFNVPRGDKPQLLLPGDSIRRLTLISSEVGELGNAVRQQDLVEIADALGDLLYVTFGMAVEMGLPMDKIFTEIHRSNMSKANKDGTVTKDAGGKVLKSSEFKPVNLTWLLKEEQK